MIGALCYQQQGTKAQLSMETGLQVSQEQTKRQETPEPKEKPAEADGVDTAAVCPTKHSPKPQVRRQVTKRGEKWQDVSQGSCP